MRSRSLGRASGHAGRLCRGGRRCGSSDDSGSSHFDRVSRTPGSFASARDCIDAVEVWNASYNTRYLPDPRAIALLHVVQRTRPAVVGVAGLDQHDAGNDRRTRVVLQRINVIWPTRSLPFAKDGFGTMARRCPSPQMPSCRRRYVVRPDGRSARSSIRVERTQERVTRAWRRGKSRPVRR